MPICNSGEALGNYPQAFTHLVKRRGITLGVGALSTGIATQARASVPAPLLRETA
jgi:hypothetical protein